MLSVGLICAYALSSVFSLTACPVLVRDILAQECRPSFARQRMEAEHHRSTPVLEPFLDKNTHLNKHIFQYPSPFGFLDMKNKLQDILELLPASSEERHGGRDCRRCLVIGNGGILKGLGLGALLTSLISSSGESLLCLNRLILAKGCVYE